MDLSEFPASLVFRGSSKTVGATENSVSKKEIERKYKLNYPCLKLVVVSRDKGRDGGGWQGESQGTKSFGRTGVFFLNLVVTSQVYTHNKI